MKQKSVVNIIFCLAVAAALALAAGCRRETPEALLRADALIEEHPDSALAILESITPAALPSERDRAIHALLSTQARAHTYTPQNDSLVSLALSYFNSEDSLGEYALRARYYKALIDQDYAHEARTALEGYLKTLYLAKKIQDHFRAGASALRIAEIFQIHNMPNEALFYSKEAFDNFENTDKKAHAAYSGLLIGTAFNMLDLPDSALLTFDNFKRDVSDYCGEDVKHSLNEQIITSYYIKKQYNDVISLCNGDTSVRCKNPIIATYYGISLVQTGNISMAKHILSKMRSTYDEDDIHIQILKNEISRYLNPDIHVANPTESILNYYIHTYNTRENLGLSGIYLSYLDQKTRLDEETIKNRMYLVWLIISFSLLVCVIVGVIIMYRRRELKRKLSEQIEFIELLNKSLNDYKTRLSETTDRLQNTTNRLQNMESAEPEIATIILSKFDILNDISCLDIDFRELFRKAGKSKYTEELKKLMQNLSSDTDIYKKIADAIDKNNGNIYSLFEQDFPDLSFDLKRLFLYHCMNISSRLMQQLMDSKNIMAIYNLNKKLKEIIRSSDSDNKESFLLKI